jgi:hypothetical protein
MTYELEKIRSPWLRGSMHFRSLDCEGADEGARQYATFDCSNADAPRSDATFDGPDANAPRSNDEFSLGPSTL